VVLSEYGLTNVSDPVHPNRILRERGLLAVRSERGRDVIDPGASIAFAVADHQVAHVYVNDPARLEEIRGAFAHLPGVDAVLGRTEQAAYRVDHERAGDLILVAAPNAWFTYYYWLDDARAPDYARTVDIHRKPGYDPVELFIDPAIRLPAATVGWKLLKRSVGMRSLLDVIPLDARLVRGSHGRPGPANDLGPVLISRNSDRIGSTTLRSTDVHQVLMRHLNLG
jgi:predicted AlkP superfamily pyrophosphatase or phosphodiesterase